jgi:hypothetical protein
VVLLAVLLAGHRLPPHIGLGCGHRLLLVDGRLAVRFITSVVYKKTGKEAEITLRIRARK